MFSGVIGSKTTPFAVRYILLARMVGTEDCVGWVGMEKDTIRALIVGTGAVESINLC
jgi:hypothetical protein